MHCHDPSINDLDIYISSLDILISIGTVVFTSGRHFASASDLLALTVALARILALKR